MARTSNTGQNHGIMVNPTTEGSRAQVPKVIKSDEKLCSFSGWNSCSFTQHYPICEIVPAGLLPASAATGIVRNWFRMDIYLKGPTLPSFHNLSNHLGDLSSETEGHQSLWQGLRQLSSSH